MLSCADLQHSKASTVPAAAITNEVQEEQIHGNKANMPLCGSAIDQLSASCLGGAIPFCHEVCTAPWDHALYVVHDQLSQLLLISTGRNKACCCSYCCAYAMHLHKMKMAL
jgi:hypothetical protein